MNTMMNDMDDFTFYLQFTKPMILNLPNIKDRVMGALWLEKLSEINESNPKDNLHVEYLKLLLLALQRNNLVGIFKEHPPEGSLSQYPEMNTAMDMIKLVKSPKSKSPFPSIYTAIGGGMREFTAVQEIPNFGLHGYYAISNEPLPLWTHNKSELLKNSRNTKNISRFKDSHEYKKLKEIDLLQITSQKGEAATRVISDTQKTNKADEMGQKQDQIEEEGISEIETRPCWGTSRYFERLIDESHYLKDRFFIYKVGNISGSLNRETRKALLLTSFILAHITADLEAATTDALLNVFKDRKSRLDKEMNDSCVLSIRRKQLEKLDSKCSSCAYDAEYRSMQCQEDLQNPENIEIPGINSYMKDNTYILKNKSRNKWRNKGTHESSIFSKSCFLDPDYCTRL